MSSSDVNFRIVEYVPPVVDYEEFKEDFLNPMITVEELKEKYNLGRSEWNHYRSRVLEDTGLSRKPSTRMGVHPTANYEYIQKIGDGYVISKTIGVNTRYYGRYTDYDTAKMVRDKLIESGWDNHLGMYLRDKYAIARRKPAYEKAVEIYPVFEDYYLNSSLTIPKIRERMGISQNCYRYLLAMVRDKTGIQHRRWRRR